MSPRPRQNTMVKSSSDRYKKVKMSRSIPTSVTTLSTSFSGDMTGYSSRSRSATSHSDDSAMWTDPFSGHFSGPDEAHFGSLPMDPMNMHEHPYVMPVMSSSQCYDSPTFDHFSQGPMSQTLAGPLLEPSYQDTMMSDELMHPSPVSMDYSGYGHTSQHTWRHGQLSPPAEIFHTELSDFSLDPACDMSFQALPESALPGSLGYNKDQTSVIRQGQPRPLRSALEKASLDSMTLAPQDIHYTRNDRADKVKARNDPRYDASPDKDGYYHCPMLNEGSCNHKPTKQKCIYAKYLDSHLKPYVCTHGQRNSECDGARFSSNACLFRHEREAHGMHNHGLNPYLCMYPGCERSRQGNGFPRRWNQRDHMKRVHSWEDLESSGFDNQDPNAHDEPNKRRRSGHSNSVSMKRSSSSHAKAQAVSYGHGSRHNMIMSRYTSQAEKQMHTNMMAYPMQFDDVHFSQVPPYHQQSRSSESYPNSYLVAY